MKAFSKGQIFDHPQLKGIFSEFREALNEEISYIEKMDNPLFYSMLDKNLKPAHQNTVIASKLNTCPCFLPTLLASFSLANFNLM